MITFRFKENLTLAPLPRGESSDRLRQDVADLTGLDIQIDESVDFEDWAECALQLVEVLRSGAETMITWAEITGYEEVSADDMPFSDFLDENPEHAETFFSPQSVPEYSAMTHRVSGDACAPALLGVSMASDVREIGKTEHAWPLPQNDVALRYPETLTFQRNAGRRMILCDMPGGQPDFVMPVGEPLAGTGKQTSLEEALAAFEGQDVVVKQTLPLKAMPVRFVSVVPGKIREAARRVFEADPYHILHHEGDRDTLLVQEKLTLSHETRYFVVDGAPVSGAGCIEAHTPLDRDPEQVVGVTHAVFETERNAGEIVVDRDAAARMEAFVRTVAAELQAELPDLRHVVIDVALNGAGEPVVIELNPYQNSGLYANDPAAIFSPITQLIKEKDLDATPGF